MTKEKILIDAGYRKEVFNSNGVKFTLRELSLAQRRAVLDAVQNQYPAEITAALAVAFSVPEFNEDDVERLVEEVRPEILLLASQRVFELSGMTGDAKAEAKKPLGKDRSGALPFSWLWRWAKPLVN